MRAFANRAAAVGLALTVAACATPIGVKRISPAAAERSLTANVLTSGHPSAASVQLLNRLGLTQRFAKEPVTALRELHEGLGGADERDRLLALSELSFGHAQAGGHRAYYLSSAVYAYAFLFPDDPQTAPKRYDPRVRLALDLYNRGIVQGLRNSDKEEVDLGARTLALPFGELDLAVDPSGFHYGGYALEHFVSLTDLEVRGLRDRYRHAGIGAPLSARGHGSSAQVDKWLPPNQKVPVTLLLRLHDVGPGLTSGHVHGTIELYDTDSSEATKIGSYSVPLEFDPTAALAYRLEGAAIWDFEIAGFRRGDFGWLGSQPRLGLFMLHPYVPGRIPVVFVHGTASSPARWAEMVNELMGDATIRRRFQFWFFIYNTGNPVAYSAMRLREDLQAVTRDVDPEGHDPALHEMVVIGHSQGGLLTKMTVVSSGTRFWDSRFPVPFEQADLSSETKDLLRRSLFVEPLPFVKQVIFIATPHRGSFLAENFLGKIARRLISVPATITKAGVELVKLNPTGAAETAWRMPTAIDNMDWSNPFLRTLASLPIAPGVHAHSIIAVKGEGPPEDGDDGVVKYTSAHIDGVESELVVRSAHSCQSDPRTIEEVRRVLYEELGKQ